MKITINGHNDDTVEFQGIESFGRFYNPTSNPIKFAGNLVDPEGNGIRIIAIYDNMSWESSSSWSFALGEVSPDDNYPDWDICMESADNPGMIVTIEAPDGTVLIPDDLFLN